MKRFGLIVLLLLANVLAGQNVSIKATGKNIGGKQVRLAVSGDCFSGLETVADRVQLGEEETECGFALTLDGVSIVSLKIDCFEFAFLAEPGKIYELDIDSINYALSDSLNLLLNRAVLPIEITNLAPDDINCKIAAFDAALEDFIVANDKALLVQKDSVAVSELYKLVDGFVKTEDSTSYFATYTRYELGKIEYALRLKGRKEQRARLFKDMPIHYYNVGYADCFNHVFERYFAKGNRYVSQDELEFWLSTNNYDDLTDALGKDEVLKNEVFRELVLIKGMRDAYIDGVFERADIIKMLEKIVSRTKFDPHRTIARNTIEFLRLNSYSGTQAREFEVLDLAGEKQVLGKENARPTILNFVKLNDESSKRELEVVNYMYESLKENCNIVTVCCDNSLDAMYNFLRNSKIGSRYKWNFVYFDSNYDLLEYYQVQGFPHFVLVSPQGRIEENPMRNPSEGSLSKFQSKENKEQ